MATYFDLCLEAPSPFDPSRDSLLKNPTFTSLLRKASYLGYSVVAINSTLHLHSRSSPSKGSGEPFLHPLREPVPILQAKELFISSLRQETKEKPREHLKRESLFNNDSSSSLMPEACTGGSIGSLNDNAIPPSPLDEASSPSPPIQQAISSSSSPFSSSSSRLSPSSSSLPLSSFESFRRSLSSSSSPPVTWISPSASPFHGYTTTTSISSSSSFSSSSSCNFLYIPRGCSVTGSLSSMWGDLLPYAVSATSAQQYLSLSSLPSSSSASPSHQPSFSSPSIASLHQVLSASSVYKADQLQTNPRKKKNKNKEKPSMIIRKKEEEEEERIGESLKHEEEEEDIEMRDSETKESSSKHTSEMNSRQTKQLDAKEAGDEEEEEEEERKNEDSKRLLVLLPRSPDVQIDLLQLRRVTVVLYNVSAAANFSTLFPPNPPYYPSLSPGASCLPASCIDILAIQPTDDLTWQFACSSCECDLISIDFSVSASSSSSFSSSSASSSSSSITENAKTKTSMKASQNALTHTQALAAALKEREEEEEREREREEEENGRGERRRVDLKSGACARHAAEEDLVSLPRKLPFSIRRKHVQQAIRRGLYFEINLSHFLSSSSSSSPSTPSSSSSQTSSKQEKSAFSSSSPDATRGVSPSSSSSSCSSLISALSNLQQLLRYIPPSRLLVTSGARREEELFSPHIQSSLLAALRIGSMGTEGVRLSSEASRNLLARAAATRHAPGGACIGGWIGAGK